MPIRPFETMTAVTSLAPGRYRAHADPEWTIGGKPNGGYLLALLGRAAIDISEHQHIIAASAHYLRAPDPGPVDIWVEVLRAGRTATQLRARLSQDDNACVEALFTTAILPADSQPHWDAGVPTLTTADRAAAQRLSGTNPQGVPVPIMDQVDLRIDPDTYGFARNRPSGRGELWGWLSLLAADEVGTDFDPVSLLFAVDALPPATFDIELTGWVPTLELTVYVRALPAPGPLRIMQRARLIEAQRVDEECWVWDSRGRVVAHATQLAGIRLG